MRKLLLFIVFISLLGINIHLLAEVILDGTLGRSGALLGPDYSIEAELGQQHGGNLFHSFRDFNLNSSESATFYGPNTVQNLISRVTGGNTSNIDGLFRSTIPGANVYFLNPDGIMFGPNAKLDVQGSFHASTADYLRLGEDGRFDAREPNNSLLTVAPVEAFGFLDHRVAPISVHGDGKEIAEADWDGKPTGLTVPTGKMLSLIGGNLEISQGTFFHPERAYPGYKITRLGNLTAPAGQINLASVASPGEVKLGNGFIDVSSITKWADIFITNKSMVQVSGQGGGKIFIRGGQLVAHDSDIESKTLGSQSGGAIDIQAQTILLTDGAKLNADIIGTGAGADITLRATDSITVVGENSEAEISAFYVRSGISKQQTADHLGNPGQMIDTIILRATEVMTEVAETSEAEISAISDRSGIDEEQTDDSLGGSNQIADIILRATGPMAEVEAEISAIYARYGTQERPNDNFGDAGQISVEAKGISFQNGAFILAETYSGGKGGNVTLSASETVNFSNSGITSTTVSQQQGAGNGGVILIDAKNISIENAVILAGTLGNGNGGDVTLRASEAVNFSEGGITSTTLSQQQGAGDGGTIQFDAKNIAIENATILSGTLGNGKSGNVTLRASEAVNFSNSGITSTTMGQQQGSGDGGALLVDASNISFENSVILADTWNQGNGGDVTLRASEAVNFSNSGITSTTMGQQQGSGDGGTLLVDASNISFENSVILADTWNQGNGGDVILRASEAVNFSNSGITSTTVGQQQGAGDGGLIFIEASSISFLQGVQLLASTSGRGNGGTITLHADHQLKLTGVAKSGEASRIDASTTNMGNAGHLVIEAQEVLLTDGASVASETKNTLGRAGSGGVIELKAKRLILEKGGIITTSTAGGGQGGNINIQVDGSVTILGEAHTILKSRVDEGGNFPLPADQIHVKRSQLSAASSGDGNAGHIVLYVGDQLKLENGGAITTATTSADGGNITITSPGYLYLINGDITTSVGAEDGDGGNISLSPTFIVQDSGKIIARAVSGNGGNINITTTGIYQFPPAEKSSIDASSQYGLDGVIQVDSPDVDISGQLLALPADFVEVADQMQPPCSAQTAENMSRFTVVQSEGVANAPNDLLPSGPLLSVPMSVKTTKSIKGTMAKRSPPIAYLTECRFRFSKPVPTATNSSTKASTRSVIDEQLF